MPGSTSPAETSNTKKYRLNVAGILRDPTGRILICERNDFPGSWQFAQGGVDAEESLEEAFAREIREELSLEPEDYQVVARKGPYRYLFEKPKRKFDGCEQHYFLADYIADATRVDVATAKPEFRAVRWIFPREFDSGLLPAMKRDVYRAVWKDFFDLELFSHKPRITIDL